MKLLICSLMVFALIGCDSTTYECVEVWGEVGVIQDGCLVEPLADVQIEFNPLPRIDDMIAKVKSTPYRMVDDKFVFHDIQTTVSDSLGRWILTLNPGEYIVYFEKFEASGDLYPKRIYYNSHLVTVPNQSKWKFTNE